MSDYSNELDSIVKTEGNKNSTEKAIYTLFWCMDGFEHIANRAAAELAAKDAELARLHKQVGAGEKLARRMGEFRLAYKAAMGMSNEFVQIDGMWDEDDEAALKEWEEVSK